MPRGCTQSLRALALLLTLDCSSRQTLLSTNLTQSALFITAANAPVGSTSTAQVGLQLILAGQPVAAVPVMFTANGCQLSNPNTVTDPNGMASSLVTCQQPRQSLLSATLEIVGQSLTFPSTLSINFYTPADGQTAIGAGTSLNALATATAGGRIDATSTTKLHFSSSDPNATLPADTAFVAADHGCKVLTDAIILRTPGAQTVSVTDAGSGATIRKDTFTVVSSSVVALRLSAPSTIVAGQGAQLRLSAVDALGNVNPFYAGTVHFSSSDPNATLPVDSTFTVADAGTQVFEGAAWQAAGQQTLNATDTTTGMVGQAGIQVTAAPAARLHLELPAAVVAGTPQTVSVRLSDTFGNLASTYTGAVHFSTTDTDAVLPPDTTFSAADAGIHTWTQALVLRSAGSQSVLVQDLVAATLSDQAVTVVTPVSATHLVVVANATTTAGVPLDVTVSAVNALGQVATNYNGAVSLSSSDAQASVTARYTFQPSDAGSHVFRDGATLRSAGNQTLQATDTANLMGSAEVAVTSSAAASLAVSGVPTSVAAGTPLRLTVSALDSYANIATTYTGVVQLQSGDPRSTVPADLVFAAGDAGVVQAASVLVFGTVGTQTVTAADANDAAVAGDTVSTTVLPGSPNSLQITLSPSDPVNPNQTFCLGVQCLDAYGNLDTSYSGTIAYSSSDPNAAFPANHTFASGDSGAYTSCGLSLYNVGVQSVTVADVAASQLSATVSPIYVAHACTSYGTSLATGLSGSRNGTSFNPSLVLDANDAPVIAWTDYSPGSGQIFLRRWQNSNWLELAGSGSASGLSANPNSNDMASLLLNGAGNPVVSWQAGGSGDSGGLYAMAYGGSSWSGVSPSAAAPPGLTGTNGIAQVAPQTALGANGNLVVAFVGSPGGASDVFALQSSGAAWQAPGGNSNVSQMPGHASAAALATDATGLPYVAWQADSAGNPNHEIFVAKFNGSAWVGLAGSSSGGGISNTPGDSVTPSLALTAAGHPVVAWSDMTSGNWEIYLRAWDGSAWTELAASGSGGGISNTATPSTIPAVATNASGALVVSWQDTPAASAGKYRIFLRNYTGAAWQELHGSASNVGTNLGAYNSNLGTMQRLRLDSLGNPVLAWQTDFGWSYNQFQIHACVWR